MKLESPETIEFQPIESLKVMKAIKQVELSLQLADELYAATVVAESELFKTGLDFVIKSKDYRREAQEIEIQKTSSNEELTSREKLLLNSCKRSSGIGNLFIDLGKSLSQRALGIKKQQRKLRKKLKKLSL